MPNKIQQMPQKSNNTTTKNIANVAKPTKPNIAHTVNSLEMVLVLEKTGIKQESLTKILGLTADQLKKLVLTYNETKQKENSALRIVAIEKRYELSIDIHNDNPILEYYKKKKKQLSDQSLETVAIVAYRQPITKAEIDKVRGANSSGPLKLLLTEQLIVQTGIKQGPGNPSLYGTTKKFLRHFSLNSLSELPPLQEVKNYSFLKTGQEQEQRQE